MAHSRAWARWSRRTLLEAAPAVVLVVLAQIEVWTTHVDVSPRLLVALLLLCMTVPLFWRRRHVLVTAVICIGAMGVISAGWQLLDNFNSPIGTLLVLTYSGAAHNGARLASVVGGLIALFVSAGVVIDGQPIGDLVFILVILGAVWIAGRAVHTRQQRASALADRAVLLEHERDAKARAAVAEERVRIARELHDVVAHGISVIVLQARGGRKVLSSEEAEAREAFEEIETTAQQALTEMRRLLGMLRERDEELALGPQPSLVNLDALAAHVRDAGLPVEIVVEGDLGRVPPGVDLSAYRLVQEGLTNALKHAGPARARVFVGRRGDELEIEVVDDGRGLNGSGDSTGGHGLPGMRERVTMLGGRLEVGPRDGGGFAVHARLPLDGASE